MKYKNHSFKVAFVGMMLSLTLLFQYFERFWDLKIGYVQLNISIIFILATSFIVGKRWAVVLIILRFAIGPSISSLGYSGVGIWSQFALIIYDGIFLMAVYLLVRISKNIYAAVSIASITIITVAPFLNGLIITPVFWKLFNYQETISFYDSINAYQYAKPLFFNIPNYWAGMYAAYTLANLIKFAIVSFTFLALWRVIEVYYQDKKFFVKNKYINRKIKIRNLTENSK